MIDLYQKALTLAFIIARDEHSRIKSTRKTKPRPHRLKYIPQVTSTTEASLQRRELFCVVLRNLVLKHCDAGINNLEEATEALTVSCQGAADIDLSTDLVLFVQKLGMLMLSSSHGGTLRGKFVLWELIGCSTNTSQGIIFDSLLELLRQVYSNQSAPPKQLQNSCKKTFHLTALLYHHACF